MSQNYRAQRQAYAGWRPGCYSPMTVTKCAAAPGTPQEAWDNWTRSGVNQFRQAHFLSTAGPSWSRNCRR